MDQLKIESATAGDLSIGWSTSRTPATEIRTYHVDVPHSPMPRTFALLGDSWYRVCGRCGGSGNYGSGPHNGVCYLCNGSGHTDSGISSQELDEKIAAWAKRAAAASRATERKVAAANAERIAWRTEHADLIAWAESLTPTETVVVDSYVHIEPTQAAAETPDGRSTTDSLVRSKELEDGQWWALFEIRDEVFDGLSARVQSAVRTLRDGGCLDKRDTGYLKAVAASETERAQAEAEAGQNSRHAATEGRLTITGKVAMVQERDGGYRFVKVEGTGADTGITWITNGSGESVWDLAEGDRVQVKATIKRNEVYKGTKTDRVGRAVFTVLDDTAPEEDTAVTTTPAPAPAVEPAAPAEAPSAPVTTQQPTPRATRRATQGASVMDGWDVLYDKPRAKAQVVKNTDGAYGLVCTDHKTLHPLTRLTDERALRQGPRSAWCTECTG